MNLIFLHHALNCRQWQEIDDIAIAIQGLVEAYDQMEPESFKALATGLVAWIQRLYADLNKAQKANADLFDQMFSHEVLNGTPTGKKGIQA